MKNKRLWILLAGIALLSITFLFVNFRVALSNTQTEKFVAVTDLGEGDMPVSMQQHDRISLALVGKGPLVRALQTALVKKMDEAGLPEIELVQELEPAYPNPVLIVKVGKPGAIWTPFLAISEVPIHAGYTSDGDSTFMEPIEKTHTSVGKKDVAFLYAEYEVRDLSLGLISRLGHHQYLANYFAQELVTALKDLYQM
jgi:hypothetical protein